MTTDAWIMRGQLWSLFGMPVHTDVSGEAPVVHTFTSAPQYPANCECDAGVPA